MTNTFESRTITVRIDRPQPEVMSSPRSRELPAMGVRARQVAAEGGAARGDFTLFRLPDMTNEAFARDVEWVERHLRALKALLEG